MTRAQERGQDRRDNIAPALLFEAYISLLRSIHQALQLQDPVAAMFVKGLLPAFRESLLPTGGSGAARGSGASAAAAGSASGARASVRLGPGEWVCSRVPPRGGSKLEDKEYGVTELDDRTFEACIHDLREGVRTR